MSRIILMVDEKVKDSVTIDLQPMARSYEQGKTNAMTILNDLTKLDASEILYDFPS